MCTYRYSVNTHTVVVNNTLLRVMAQRPWPRLQGCAIYVHDALGASSAARLHSDYDSCDGAWEKDKYSQQLWLERALLSSPWRVRADKAEVTFLAGHDFARWCTVAGKLERLREDRVARGQKAFIARERICSSGNASRGPRPLSYLFDGSSELVTRARIPRRPGRLGVSRDDESKASILRKLLNDTGGGQAARILVLSNSECTRFFPPPGRPEGMILLVDRKLRAYYKRKTRAGPGAIRHRTQQAALDVTIPYAVSEPQWLAAPRASSPVATPPFARRKLLFFGGHIPRLYTSRVRYSIWQQLRQSEHATLVSQSLSCTIGAYHICVSPARIQSEWKTFCLPWCNVSE